MAAMSCDYLADWGLWDIKQCRMHLTGGLGEGC